jgi:hypothetical protein
MAAHRNTTVNRAADITLRTLFYTFPVSCAAVAIHDVWAQGLASPIAQISLGIAATAFAAKVAVFGLAGTDAVIDAARSITASFRRRASSCATRIADLIAFQDQRGLSQA